MNVKVMVIYYDTYLTFYLPRVARYDSWVLWGVAFPVAGFLLGVRFGVDTGFIALLLVSLVMRLVERGSLGWNLSCFTLLLDILVFSASRFSTSSFSLTEELTFQSSFWDFSLLVREPDESLVLLVPLSLPDSYLERRSLTSSLTLFFWGVLLCCFAPYEDFFTAPCNAANDFSRLLAVCTGFRTLVKCWSFLIVS